jgi:hypothetical protein
MIPDERAFLSCTSMELGFRLGLQTEHAHWMALIGWDRMGLRRHHNAMSVGMFVIPEHFGVCMLIG